MSHPLYKLLRELEAAFLDFIIGRYREDSLTVLINLVGERVEVDVFEDGHMEVSRFAGSEAVVGDEQLVYQILDKNRN